MRTLIKSFIRGNPNMAKRKEELPTEEVVKLISASKLRSLLSSAQKAKEDCGEINGALGEEIKTAIDKNHLHRGAFNAIKGLYSKSPEKLREFIDHFNYYWEASGLEKKAVSAPRLPMGDDTGEEDNIHHLGAAE